MSFPETAPDAAGLHAAWYEANRVAGSVTAQRCECGHWRHPARYRCPACASDVWSFEPVDPTATIESWTVTRRPLHFAFADAVPYAIVVVVTAEGARFFVQLRVDGDPSIGSTVTLRVDSFGVPFAE